jgi:hypothetical protein
LAEGLSFDPKPGAKKKYWLHDFWPDNLKELLMDFLAHKSELKRLPANKVLSPHQRKLVGDALIGISQFTQGPVSHQWPEAPVNNNNHNTEAHACA